MIFLFYYESWYNMDFIDLKDTIESFDSIVIFRHQRPDLDALGSQIGLSEALKLNYPNKKIYMVGDSSKRYDFIGSMDNVEDGVIKNSLVIICDVACKALVSDERYNLGSKIVVIDHHKNECDIEGAETLVDTTKIACAELITNFLMATNLSITKYGATALYGGIVTDSGRFQYGATSSNTFKVAAWLLENGADKEYIYDHLYVETLKQREMKNFFSSHYTMTNEGVAYMKNDEDVLAKFPDVSFFDISRGMVNLMAGIEEITIWCNFTYDKENNTVVGEFRSRGIVIVDIAKKYGGGGHENACGATLKDFAEADLVIEDFKKLALSRRNKNGN